MLLAILASKISSIRRHRYLSLIIALTLSKSPVLAYTIQPVEALSPMSAATAARHLKLSSTLPKSGRNLRLCHRYVAPLYSTVREFSDSADAAGDDDIPLYRSQGILAVAKPLEWTSSNVVSYLRGILEQDARDRGAKPVKVGRRGNKKKMVKVGHGGTLDPLATGVLVIGVGSGTKELQRYLTGSKRYIAGAELGFETTTLDSEGNVTKTASFDHLSVDAIENVLPEFTGPISQIPPIFSALRRNGKKLYTLAREGVSADEIEIEARQVEIYDLTLVAKATTKLPRFQLDVECGGGTYIRSLVRDIGYKLDSVATMIALERTQQGQFELDKCLAKDEWSADSIYAAIDRFNLSRENENGNTESNL